MATGKETGWCEMRNLILVFLIPVCLLGLWGCREKVPETPLEGFLSQYRDLPPDVYEDSLRAVISNRAMDQPFAHYELGNVFYSAASESAQVFGWRDGPAIPLLDSALVHFEKAVELDTSFVEAFVNLGSVWDDLAEQVGTSPGERQEREMRMANAQRMYEKALRIRPDDEKAICNLGSLYLKRRMTAEAVAQFQRAMEVNPKSSLAHYNLAIVFAEEKIYREAIREWEIAAKYDPDGDIGERSRENIRIVNELLEAKVPENLGGTETGSSGN
jgi:hypothetical protein